MCVEVKFAGAVQSGGPRYVYQREIARSETAKPARTAAPWITSQSVSWPGCGFGTTQTTHRVVPFIGVGTSICTSFLGSASPEIERGPLQAGLSLFKCISVVADAASDARDAVAFEQEPKNSLGFLDGKIHSLKRGTARFSECPSALTALITGASIAILVELAAFAFAVEACHKGLELSSGSWHAGRGPQKSRPLAHARGLLPLAGANCQREDKTIKRSADRVVSLPVSSLKTIHSRHSLEGHMDHGKRILVAVQINGPCDTKANFRSRHRATAIEHNVIAGRSQCRYSLFFRLGFAKRLQGFLIVLPWKQLLEPALKTTPLLLDLLKPSCNLFAFPDGSICGQSELSIRLGGQVIVPYQHVKMLNH